MNKKNTPESNKTKKTSKTKMQNKNSKSSLDNDTIWVKADENIGNIFN